MDLDRLRPFTIPTAASASRPLFRVPSDLNLPPWSGQAATIPRHALANLLEELIDAAGCNELPAPARVPDHPSIADLFAALKAAAAGYEVAPGLCLAEYFWTHAAAIHSGEVAACLLRAVRSGRCVQGFAVLYVTDVRPPLLYGPIMRPVRVRGKIGTLNGVEGPYLALVACEGEPNGSATAIEAYAAPIFHARRFILVGSELDRDVLRALQHLQVALDAHGAECAIHRIRPEGDGRTLIEMVISTSASVRRICLAIDAMGATEPDTPGRVSVEFVVTHRNWRDGSFIAWLARAVLS